MLDSVLSKSRDDVREDNEKGSTAGVTVLDQLPSAVAGCSSWQVSVERASCNSGSHGSAGSSSSSLLNPAVGADSGSSRKEASASQLLLLFPGGNLLPPSEEGVFRSVPDNYSTSLESDNCGADFLCCSTKKEDFLLEGAKSDDSDFEDPAEFLAAELRAYGGGFFCHEAVNSLKGLCEKLSKALERISRIADCYASICLSKSDPRMGFIRQELDSLFCLVSSSITKLVRDFVLSFDGFMEGRAGVFHFGFYWCCAHVSAMNSAGSLCFRALQVLHRVTVAGQKRDASFSKKLSAYISEIVTASTSLVRVFDKLVFVVYEDLLRSFSCKERLLARGRIVWNMRKEKRLGLDEAVRFHNSIVEARKRVARSASGICAVGGSHSPSILGINPPKSGVSLKKKSKGKKWQLRKLCCDILEGRKSLKLSTESAVKLAGDLSGVSQGILLALKSDSLFLSGVLLEFIACCDEIVFSRSFLVDQARNDVSSIYSMLPTIVDEEG